MTPPSIHLSEACRRYIAWLRAISSETDFSRLVALVRGVRQGDFERLRRLPPGVLREDDHDEQVKDDIKFKGSKHGDVDMDDKSRIAESRTAGGMPGDLELVDIELAQIEDLTGMRARPEILPYRRYLYVGEMSLDRKTREKAGQAVSQTRRRRRHRHGVASCCETQLSLWTRSSSWRQTTLRLYSVG
jgi:hypothetical protein